MNAKDKYKLAVLDDPVLTDRAKLFFWRLDIQSSLFDGWGYCREDWTDQDLEDIRSLIDRGHLITTKKSNAVFIDSLRLKNVESTGNQSG